MNTGMTRRRAWTGLLWLVLAAAGCWSGGAMAQTSAGAIPDGHGRVVMLAAGGQHSCALRSTGAVACWGSDFYGESSAVPRGYFTAVTAGVFHSCALRSNGEAVCWGDNNYGQVSAPAGERFTAIATGTTHNCGLRAG
ncbi:MAG: RCC1 domain-containing protein, partial [Thermomonas sp.]